MKILQINSVCGIKSTGRICTDIAELLESAGHDCKIAYGRESMPEKYQKYAIRIGNDNDVKFHAMKSRIFDNSGFSSKKTTLEFIERVKEYKPDVIHLHNIHGYYINIEILFNFLKEWEIPVVWTLHDCWSFTGHCTHFEITGCNKWKNLSCKNCPHKKEYPKSMLIDNSASNIKKKKELFTGIKNMTIVTPSAWLASLVKESFLKEYPVKVINNGIDTEFFKPVENNFKKTHKIEDKKMILGVSSVWNTQKGYDDFIKLSELLGENYQIVLVGLNENQISKLPKNIIGIKRTDSIAELAEIYTAADVFVNPTYEDNYPTVNLEALSCNTPVITYNTGGSPEPIKEGLGVIVHNKNPYELCKAITEYDAETPINVDSSLFDKKVLFKEYIDLYERC